MNPEVFGALVATLLRALFDGAAEPFKRFVAAARRRPGRRHVMRRYIFVLIRSDQLLELRHCLRSAPTTSQSCRQVGRTADGRLRLTRRLVTRIACAWERGLKFLSAYLAQLLLAWSIAQCQDRAHEPAPLA